MNKTIHTKLYRSTALSCASAVAMVLMSHGAALANPQGGNVSAGQASIAESGKTLTVNQSSNRAVIDWRSFDIAHDETTRFVQPGSNSLTLNRVSNSAASKIMGNLTANGKVIIVNPNGVLFGKTANVDVNGLVASTANVSNQNFMAGNMKFDQAGRADASIINEGTITAHDGGLVGFVAPNVVNKGVITANMGKVAMASGDTFTLDMYGDNLMEVAVSDDVKSQLVDNEGTIKANGGKVTLTAAAGSKIVNSLITVSGDIEANSVSQHNGEIIIGAVGSNDDANNAANRTNRRSGNSRVRISSARVIARGKDENETGGSITVTGDDISIQHGSVLDVSGNAGGGSIKIGGDFHGAGATARALTTNIDTGVNIYADAINSGNGGTVAVWSDDTTRFYGNIYARGGAQSGDGGFVETSGHENLAAHGRVDLSSIHGQFGTWLLDPATITIDNRALANGNASTIYTTSDIETMAVSANVSLTATTSIILDFTGDTLNIGTSGRTLTFSAPAYTVSSNSTINTTNGAISFNGTAAMTLNGNLTTNSGSATTTFAGTINDGTANTHNLSVTAGTATFSSTVGATTNINNLTLTADTLSLAGNLKGGGTLSIDTKTAGRAMSFNGASAFNLTTTQIGYIQNTWSAVNIGSGSNSSVITLGAATWNAPTTFTTTNVAANAINITGTQTGSGNLVFAGKTTLGYAGTVITTATANKNITFNNAVTLGANSTLTAGTGTLTFGSTLDGAYTLTTTAATTTFSGNVGGTTKLGNTSITTDSVSWGSTFGGTGTFSLLQKTASDTWNIANGTSSGLYLTSAQWTPLTSNWSSLTIGNSSATGTMNIGALTVPATTNFTVGATGSINLAGTITGASSGTLTFTGPTVMNYSAGNLFSGTGQALTFASATTIAADATINTGGGALTFSSTLDSAVSTSKSLTSNTGAATTTFTGNVGATTALNNLNVTAGLATLTGTIKGTGTLTLQPYDTTAAINPGASSGGFWLSTTEIGKIQSAWNLVNIGTASDTGVITISGTNTWAANTTFTTTNNTAGAITVTGAQTGSGNLVFAGLTTLNFLGTPITTATANKNITFNNDVVLGANTTLTAGGGTLTFSGKVDATSAGTQTLTTTAANTIFTGAVGGTTALGTTIINTDAITNAAMTGTGALSIIQKTAGTTWNIANGATTGLWLSAAEWNNLNNSWSSITLGNSSATGTMNIGALTIGRPTTNFTVGTTGTVNLAGTITGASSGTLTITGPTTMNYSAGNLFSGTGQALTFASAVTLSNNATINTGGGALTFSSTIDGAKNLTTNSGSATTTFTGNVGATTGLTNLDVTAGLATLTGTIKGTGNLTLAPYDTTAAINPGATSGGFWLSTTEVGKIQSGWTNVYIGRSDGSDTGVITLSGTQTWASPTTFTTTNSGAGAINVTAAQTGSGNLVFAGKTTLGFAGTAITTATANANITFNNAVTLGANTTLTAGGGTLTFGNTLDGAYTLTTTAATTNFNGAVGGTAALGNTTINTDAMSNVAMTGTGTLSIIQKTAGDTWNIANGTSTGLALSTTQWNNLQNSWSSITLGNSSATGTMNIGALTIGRPTTNFTVGTTGTVNLAGTITGASSGTLTITGPTTMNYSAGNLFSGTGQALTFASAITLSDNATINTGGGALTFSSTINGAKNLTTNSGAATTTFTGNVGATTSLADLNVTAGLATLTGTIKGTGTLTLQPYDTTAAINPGVGSGGFWLSTTELGKIQSGWTMFNLGTSSDTGVITLPAITWSVPTTFTSTRSSGAINITGAQTANANLTFNGATTFSTSIPEVSTNGVNVTFNSPVTLAVGSALSTSAAGSLTFNGAINGAYNLTVTSGSVFFNSTVGATTPIAQFAITADNLTIGGSMAGTGNITILPLTTSRNMEFGTGTKNTGTLQLSSTEMGYYMMGGWGSIIQGSTSDTGNMTVGAFNSASSSGFYASSTSTINFNGTLDCTNASKTNTITAGTVNFNAAVGSNSALGNYTITTDNLAIGANFASTGALIINPITTTRTININSGVDDGTNLNISSAELNYIQPGWLRWTIGSTSNANTINVGALTVKSGGSYTYLNTSTAGTINLNSAVEGNSAGVNSLSLTAGTVNVASTIGQNTALNNLTFAANTLSLNGNLYGTGTIQFGPATANTAVDVNASAAVIAAYPGLVLTDANTFAYVQPNWTQMTIGSSTANYINLGQTSWYWPMYFYAGGTISGGARVDIRGTQTGLGNATSMLFYGGDFVDVKTGSYTGATIDTTATNGSITMNGMFILQDTSFLAGTGAITFGYYGPTSWDGTGLLKYNLTLNAGTVNIAEKFGSNGQGLGNVNIITDSLNEVATGTPSTFSANSVTIVPQTTTKDIYINASGSGAHINGVTKYFSTNTTIGSTSDTGNIYLGDTQWGGSTNLTMNSASSIILNGAQSWSGIVTYNNPVTLATNVSLANTNIFNSTLDGAYTLTTSGATTYKGAVGSITPLTAIVANSTTTLSSNIIASNALTFNGNVTLGANSSLTVNNGTLTFGGTLGGAYNLTTNAATTTFTGAVSGLKALSVTTDSLSIGSSFAGTSTFGLYEKTANDTWNIANGVNSGLAVSSSAWNAIQAGGFTSVTLGDSNASGTMNVGNINLSRTTNFTMGSSGTLSFGTIDGAYALNVNATTANFNGDLGGTVALGNVTFTGLNDLALNHSLLSSGTVAITTSQDFTIGAGATVTGNALTLKSAGGNINGTGLLTLNGALRNGSGALTLQSGTASDGSRADLTLDSSSFSQSTASIAGINISGYHDISLNTNMTSSIGFNVTAKHNLTVGTGATVTAGGGGGQGLNLYAANGDSANDSFTNGFSTTTGILTINGTINTVNAAAIKLLSGRDDFGNTSADLVLDTAHFTNLTATNINGFTIKGFRDVTISTSSKINLYWCMGLGVTAARDILFDSVVGVDNIASHSNNYSGFGLYAGRNITFGSNSVITLDQGGQVYAYAAGGNTNNVGQITFNGHINTSGMTLYSGLDNSGNRADLTLDGSNTVFYNLGRMHLDLYGYRDVNIDTAINTAIATINTSRDVNINGAITASSSSVTVNAGRDVSIDSAINTGSVNINANRNITVDASSTITTNGSGVVMNAAGGNTSGTGVIAVNGQFNLGSQSVLFLTSGLDGSGHGADLTLDGAHLNMTSSSFAAATLVGFNDVNVNSALRTANSFYINAKHDINIGGSGSIATTVAGYDITLVAGRNFVNNGGANALSENAGSAGWLVYSSNPTDTVAGGLVEDFHRYSCTYGGSCPSIPATGNGFLYSETPYLTVNVGSATVTYGDAVNLAGNSYTLSGYLGNDASVNNLSGSVTSNTGYVQGNHVGNYDITSSGNLASDMGYGFIYATNTNGLTVNQRSIAIAADAVSATYGDTMGTLNYHVTNGSLYGSDTLSGALTTANGGAGTVMSHANGFDVANGPVAITQGNLSNSDYAITYTGANISLAAKTLTQAGVVVADKTYDSTLSANITNHGSLSGVVTGDTVSVDGSGAVAAFDGIHAGSHTVALSGYGLGGSEAGNYVLSAQASTTANITPAALAIAADAVSATYGDTMGTLNYHVTNGSLYGSDTLSGALTTAHGGAGTVMNHANGFGVINPTAITLGTLGNSDYAINYTGADITLGVKSLIVSNLIAANKRFDNNNNAFIQGTPDITPIAGDDVRVAGYPAGTFTSSEVGNWLVNIAGITLTGAEAANYRLVLPQLTASITGLPQNLRDAVNGTFYLSKGNSAEQESIGIVLPNAILNFADLKPASGGYNTVMQNSSAYQCDLVTHGDTGINCQSSSSVYPPSGNYPFLFSR